LLISLYHVAERRIFFQLVDGTLRGPMKDDDLPDIGHVSTEIIDGLQIRLSRSGRTDGLPILFTSPWPESIYAFHRVLPYFVEAHSVIMIDLPGFGLSESRSDVMSPRAMGAFLVKVAAHLNLNRLHGVGPDVGALAFLFAAADHPGLFQSLAVGGAATRVDLAGGRLKDIIASPKGAFAAIDGADAVSNYLTQASQITPAAIIDDFRRASAGRRFEDAAQYVRAYKEDLPLLEQRLAQIRTPVLVIAGKNDPIVPPANNQLLADRLPRNRLSLLEAAHRAWEEATENYCNEIISWFGGGARAA
jgi:pimeloyl-ACP methyl ester carboxylesterase